MLSHKVEKTKDEIIKSIRKKEASLLEASSFEYIESKSAYHFYNEDNEEIMWFKGLPVYNDSNFYKRPWHITYNVTKNSWDFFYNTSSICSISPFDKNVKDIQFPDDIDKNILEEFDSEIPDYNNLLLIDKANLNKFKSIYKSGIIIKKKSAYRNNEYDIFVIENEPKWKDFGEIVMLCAKIDFKDKKVRWHKDDYDNFYGCINCSDKDIQIISQSELENECEKYMSKQNEETIKEYKTVESNIEKYKNIIENTQSKIIECQTKMIELSNSIKYINVKTKNFTNDIIFSVKQKPQNNE